MFPNIGRIENVQPRPPLERPSVERMGSRIPQRIQNARREKSKTGDFINIYCIPSLLELPRFKCLGLGRFFYLFMCLKCVSYAYRLHLF